MKFTAAASSWSYAPVGIRKQARLNSEIRGLPQYSVRYHFEAATGRNPSESILLTMNSDIHLTSEF